MIESIVYLFISATLIIYIGSYARDKMKFLPNGKTEWQKLALILLYGTVPFYVLLVGLKLPTMGTLIGLGVGDNPLLTGTMLILGGITAISINLINSQGYFGAGATILWLIIAIVIVVIKASGRN